MILVTGATGYVGGRLLDALERGRANLRVLARTPAKLAGRTRAEVVAGDVGDPAAVARALAGVRCAYYLVHSLASDGGFGEEERRGASVFATAARAAGVERIVYLGGIVHGDDLSRHLASRRDVGRILRCSGVPALELPPRS